MYIHRPSPLGPGLLLHHLFSLSRHRFQSRGLPSHHVSHSGMTGLVHHWVTALTCCFFCLFLELPFPHEALLCTMTATATSNHISFIEMLQPRSAVLYLDITMLGVLCFAAVTSLGLFLSLMKITCYLKMLFCMRRLYLVITRGMQYQTLGIHAKNLTGIPFFLAMYSNTLDLY